MRSVPYFLSPISPYSEQFGGESVVQIASDKDLKGVNQFVQRVAIPADLEIMQDIEPLEFEARASISITARQARNILTRMGVSTPQPGMVNSYTALRDTIENQVPLNLSQIRQFIQEAEDIGGIK